MTPRLLLSSTLLGLTAAVAACASNNGPGIFGGVGGGSPAGATTATGTGTATHASGSTGAGTTGGHAGGAGGAAGGTAKGGAAGTGTASGGAGGAATTGAGVGGATSTSSTSTSSTGGAGGGPPLCSPQTQFIYTLAEDNTLYRFYPPTLTFTTVGVLNCPSIATPFSMAVDRDANAWVVFTDGTLYKVDAQTATCKATAFVPGQSSFTTFGMGFSADSPGSVNETLFVSGDANQGLAKINLTTFVLAPIAPYTMITGRAELTGTGNGSLFGAFEGTPYVVAGIEKATAAILSMAPQAAINYPPDSSNFAFGAWGGDFYLFVGPGTSTDVFHYQPGAAMTTKVLSVPQVIVGAGVSTCAPG